MRVLALCVSVAAGIGGKIVAPARKQIGVKGGYDPACVSLDYPNGDVPQDRGVCTDVVIRALRTGLSKDLQKLVHEDMRSHFSDYPKAWGVKRTDRSIDHRRVPNLRTFFKRRGFSRPLPKAGAFSGHRPLPVEVRRGCAAPCSR